MNMHSVVYLHYGETEYHGNSGVGENYAHTTVSPVARSLTFGLAILRFRNILITQRVFGVSLKTFLIRSYKVLMGKARKTVHPSVSPTCSESYMNKSQVISQPELLKKLLYVAYIQQKGSYCL
jgi:hypothetical protein